MLTKIKAIVTETEMSEIDRVVEEIYSIDDGSNHSVAFQLGLLQSLFIWIFYLFSLFARHLDS